MKYQDYYVIFTFEGLGYNKIHESIIAVDVNAAMADIEHSYGEKPILVGYKQN